MGFFVCFCCCLVDWGLLLLLLLGSLFGLVWFGLYFGMIGKVFHSYYILIFNIMTFQKTRGPVNVPDQVLFSEADPFVFA